MRKQHSAFSFQLSAKSRVRANAVAHFLSTSCKLEALSSQAGIALLPVVVLVVLAMIGAIIFSAPQMKEFIMPTNEVAASPTPAPSLSAKQQLYLRNEAIIKKELKLTDEQFDLLVEGADKN